MIVIAHDGNILNRQGFIFKSYLIIGTSDIDFIELISIKRIIFRADLNFIFVTADDDIRNVVGTVAGDFVMITHHAAFADVYNMVIIRLFTDDDAFCTENIGIFCFARFRIITNNRVTCTICCKGFITYGYRIQRI